MTIKEWLLGMLSGLSLMIILTLLLGCADTTLNSEDEIRVGKEVIPPYGCIELQKRGGEC